MGLAIDAIATSRTTGAGGADTTFQAVVVASGDSLTVRSFEPPAKAYLERILINGPASGQYRVRSGLLHDNVEGIQLIPGAFPVVQGLPSFARQALQPQDTLIGEIIGQGTSDVNAMVLGVAYDDLPGAMARLHTWADIANLIKSIKYLNIALASGGAEAVWLDTAFNVTETLLHANTDYAILGYLTNAAMCAIAIKGIDTSNLRVPAICTTDAKVSTSYFKDWSDVVGGPRIPIFNAANVAGTFLSAFNDEAPATTTNVQLLLAELAHNI